MNEKALLLRLERQVKEQEQSAGVKVRDLDERVKVLLQRFQALEDVVEVLKRRP